MNIKIISGGQTGADRAALDIALDFGLPCGGYCPKGRKAEDGWIPERYPLTETTSGNYKQRTKLNVIKSDATLVVTHGKPSKGSAATIGLCQYHHKPTLHIDAERVDPDTAASKLRTLIDTHGVQVLNVAGQRASSCPDVYYTTRQILWRLLYV